jgi:hypothetical protein
MVERQWAPVTPEPTSPGSMPPADVLVIDDRPDGIFLFRCTAAGEFGGDTWHRSVDEAKDQAAYEFGPDVRWRPIPETESDPVAFAIRANFKLTHDRPRD